MFVFLGVCTLFLGHTAADYFVKIGTITSGEIVDTTTGTTTTATPTNPIVFSPNGELLASGSTTGHVVLWDPETGEVVRRLDRGSTWIPYELATPAEVTVAIHSAIGQLVRTLRMGHQPTGTYLAQPRAAYWDGRNTEGEPVASGVYFYTLKAGEFTCNTQNAHPEVAVARSVRLWLYRSTICMKFKK